MPFLAIVWAHSFALNSLVLCGVLGGKTAVSTSLPQLTGLLICLVFTHLFISYQTLCCSKNCVTCEVHPKRYYKMLSFWNCSYLTFVLILRYVRPIVIG